MNKKLIMINDLLKKFSNRKKIKKDIEYKKKYFLIEKKIINIRNNLKKNKISFLHSGHLGDLINSLPVIKELSNKKKCNLYISKKKYKNLLNHSSGKFFLNDQSINKLLPLLKSLKYINSVYLHNNEPIDVDLNLFREMPINFNMDSIRWYFQLTGIHANLTSPYLNVKKINKFKKYIVIMRSLRRQNRFINYKFLEKYKNLLFVGLKDEYEDLKKYISSLEYYDCKDFYELARIIKSSKVFIGNLSFGYTIAEGVKCKRLLESHLDFPMVYPNGKNAYDFYFQKDFETKFNKLYYSKI